MDLGSYSCAGNRTALEAAMEKEKQAFYESADSQVAVNPDPYTNLNIAYHS